MNNDFGKTYAELTPEERAIVDQRMKEKRAKAAQNQGELGEEELLGVMGGQTVKFDEDGDPIDFRTDRVK